MSRMISAPIQLLQQHVVLRYVALIVALLVAVSLVFLAYARLSVSTVPNRSASQNDTLNPDHQAPQKALFKSSNAIESTGQASSKSSTNVRVEQSSTRDKSIQPTTDTTVEVNGRTIPVDANGSVHKVIRSGSQQTTLDISSSSQSSESRSSSLDVSIESSSQNNSGD